MNLTPSVGADDRAMNSQVGQVVTGVVSALTEYGAFVDAVFMGTTRFKPPKGDSLPSLKVGDKVKVCAVGSFVRLHIKIMFLKSSPFTPFRFQ